MFDAIGNQTAANLAFAIEERSRMAAQRKETGFTSRLKLIFDISQHVL
jgi:hypothetical protein